MEKLTQETVLRIVEQVAGSQLYFAQIKYDRQELVNEAYVAVMEAMKRKKNLTPMEVTTIAKRTLINWKLMQASQLSIPAGSVYKVFRDGRLTSGVFVDKFDYVGACPSGEKLHDLAIVSARVRGKLKRTERYVLDVLLGGGNISEAWKDLKKRKVKDSKRKAYEAVPVIRKMFVQELHA
jgi:hypothetical protein